MSAVTKPLALDETLEGVRQAILAITRSANVTTVADAYDSTASYAVGDLCIKDNTLYKCNTAIASGGETWTAAHWDATTVDAELELAGRVTVITNANTTLTLQPCPVTYKWGEVASLTLTVTATSQYHFMFTCPSASATVLTLSGHTGTTGDTPAAGKTYEVDVWAGVALIREVDITAVTP